MAIIFEPSPFGIKRARIIIKKPSIKNIKFTSEEPKMKKPLFESEEEFDEFMEKCYVNNDVNMKRLAEDHGYIKKSIVEKAEDAYRKYYVTENGILGQEVIEVQHKAIQHLKQKLSEAGK